MQSAEMQHAFTDYGVLINSGEWGGKAFRSRDKEMADHAKATWIWRSGSYLSHSRLGCFAAAFLGRASSDHLLRQVRHGAGAL